MLEWPGHFLLQSQSNWPGSQPSEQVSKETKIGVEEGWNLAREKTYQIFVLEIEWCHHLLIERGWLLPLAIGI